MKLEYLLKSDSFKQFLDTLEIIERFFAIQAFV
jgi:hypothetical protein